MADEEEPGDDVPPPPEEPTPPEQPPESLDINVTVEASPTQPQPEDTQFSTFTENIPPMYYQSFTPSKTNSLLFKGIRML